MEAHHGILIVSSGISGGVGNAGIVRDTHTHVYGKKAQRQVQWGVFSFLWAPEDTIVGKKLTVCVFLHYIRRVSVSQG